VLSLVGEAECGAADWVGVINSTNTMMGDPDVEAEITLLSDAEGGRQTSAWSGYRPNHRVRDDYLTTGVHQYIGCDELRPGQTVRGTISFLTPEAYPGCLWVGREIAIQEGSRLVGRARITKILNSLLERRTGAPTAAE
jgi:elongation factor Tu